MSDKTCGECRFLSKERDRNGRCKCCSTSNSYWPKCGACKAFEERFITPKKLSRTIIVMLCFLVTLLLVIAAAAKLKARESEYLAEYYRLVNENCELTTENILLKGDQECLE